MKFFRKLDMSKPFGERMKDGLPKFKDAPSAAGGSGEELPE